MASAKALYQSIFQQLEPLLGEREAMAVSNELLHASLGINRMDISLNKHVAISAEQNNFLENAIWELKADRPLQHILGKVEFYGCEIKTDKRALIPRPETEELVDWILKENIVDTPQILDIGTGTGCIPIALKKNLLKADVKAIDISDEALALAKANASLNHTEVAFHKIDILNNHFPFSELDIIVSNPPYIPEREKEEMGKNVVDFEPGMALFVPDNDPLIFYRKISELAIQHLKIGGILYFEIHENFGQELVTLIEDIGFTNVLLKQDLQGKDRMIQAQKYYR